MIMRARRRLAPLAAAATAILMAGCGAAGPPPTPKVNLSITAPTSGAIVGVHEVVVEGTVTPATAGVFVDSQPAKVVRGNFTRSLRIVQPTQTITVTAQASGYAPGSVSTTVQYSSALAHQLVSARAAQIAVSQVATSGSPRLQSAQQSLAARIRTINSGFAVHVPARPSTTAPTPKRPTRNKSTPSPTKPPITTPAPPTTRPPTTTPTPPTARPGGAPTRPPSLTVAEIKRLWLKHCAKAVRRVNLILYCTCIYNHLKRIGALSSRARVLALIKRLQAYERNYDPTKLPAFVRAAVQACLSKLPPLDPLTGKPVISRLPGLAHRSASGPTAPVP